MNWKRNGSAAILILTLLLGFSLYRCGGSGGGGGGGAITPILNTGEGAAAWSGSFSAATAGATTGAISAELDELAGTADNVFPGFEKRPTYPLVNRSPRHAKMVAMTREMVHSEGMQKAFSRVKSALSSRTGFSDLDSGGKQPCSGGGTYSSTGHTEFTDTGGSLSWTIVFENCQQSGHLFDGTMTTSGSVMEIQSPYSFSEEVALTFSDFTAETSGDVLDLDGKFRFVLSLNGSFFSPDSADFDFTATGTASFDSGVQTTMEYDGFHITEHYIADDTLTITDTYKGGVTETHTESGTPHSVAIDFHNFNVEGVGDTEADISFSGKVSIGFNPDEDCQTGGTFVLDTQEPFHLVPSQFCPVSGRLVINDNTTVQYGVAAHDGYPDGHVDVTVGEEAEHFDSCEEIEALCGFEFEEIQFED
jgi:hypothetical protein